MTQPSLLVPIELLRQLLTYNPETGELFWKDRPVEMFAKGNTSQAANHSAFQKRYAGKPAFTSKNGNGYFQGTVLSQNLLAHRVIWAMITGEWPDEVDHKDHDGSNNKWGNLRSVSHANNMKNMKLRRDNVSGVAGVSWHQRDQRWLVSIKVGNKSKHLGCFKLKSEAVAVRKAAEAGHEYYPNHGCTP